MHPIQVDDEVFRFLKRHAEPLVDTPNTVLRRLLLNRDAAEPGPRSSPSPDAGRSTGASSVFRPRLGMPASLEQILEVADLVIRGSRDRLDATHDVARRRGVAFQTVLDKYTRQLGIDTARFDLLLSKDGHEELRRLLLHRFPKYADQIRKVLG